MLPARTSALQGREHVSLRERRIEKKFTLAVAHYEANRLDEAERLFRQVLAVAPDNWVALNDLGVLALNRNHAHDAIAIFRRLLTTRQSLEVHSNLAFAYNIIGQREKAMAHFCHSLSLAPDDPAAHVGLAYILLTWGDLAAGFAELEWTWKAPNRNPPPPRWAYLPLAGKTLILHHAVGFGDTLQFCRYAPMLAARGARVLLLVPPPLRRLLTTLEGVEVMTEETSRLTPFFECSLLSLPFAFGTTLQTIPAPSRYLFADPAPWATFLRSLSGLKIGVVWAGLSRPSPDMTSIDQRRSMRLVDMKPLLAVPGCSFVSL